MRVDVSDLTQTDDVTVAAGGNRRSGGVRTVGSNRIRYSDAGTGQQGFLVANPANRHAGRGGGSASSGGVRQSGSQLLDGQAAREAGGVNNAG